VLTGMTDSLSYSLYNTLCRYNVRLHRPNLTRATCPLALSELQYVNAWDSELNVYLEYVTCAQFM